MKTELITVNTDNITDYKKTSLFLVFPYCSGKCGDKCQNKHLRTMSKTKYKNRDIIKLYQSLDTHEAVVCGGLEPFDSFDELLQLMRDFSYQDKNVDFVIYTGYDYANNPGYPYTKENSSAYFYAKDAFNMLIKYWPMGTNKGNLIIKFGPYDENRINKSWHSNVLGVDLATDNQAVIVVSSEGTITYEKCGGCP